MAAWSSWYSHVIVHARSAPEPTVDQALLDAARELLRRTRAWRVWLEPVTTLAADNQAATFAIPTASEIVRIERATLDGQPFEVGNATLERADWSRFTAGTKALLSANLTTYVLRGTFPAGQALQVQVSLQPGDEATGIPDDLAARFHNVIADGAIAELLLIPGTDFYNPELAALRRNLFDQAIGEATVQLHRGYTATVPRTRPKWC